MKKQAGFVKWEIHTNGDKGYTDIVYWESKEDAKNSEKDMVNIPNAGDWYACYKQGSISSKNLTTVASFWKYFTQCFAESCSVEYRLYVPRVFGGCCHRPTALT